MTHKHEWEIFGIVIKPNIKTPYHNNIMFKCEICDTIEMTVNKKRYSSLTFENEVAAAEWLVTLGYKIKLW